MGFLPISLADALQEAVYSGDARVGRHELSDEQWDWIEGLFPANEGRGNPWKDHRQMVNGVLWTLPTGAPGLSARTMGTLTGHRLALFWLTTGVETAFSGRKMKKLVSFGIFVFFEPTVGSTCPRPRLGAAPSCLGRPHGAENGPRARTLHLTRSANPQRRANRQSGCRQHDGRRLEAGLHY